MLNDKSQEIVILSYRCYEIANIFIAESIDGVNWNDYELAKNRIRHENDFAITYNKETNRVFLAEGLEDISSKISILYEYKQGGIFIKLNSNPINSLDKQTVGTIFSSGQLYVIYYYYQTSYTKYHAICLQINSEKPWLHEQLPLPLFGSDNYQVQFYSYNSYLYAVGKGNTQLISCRRMKFAQSTEINNLFFKEVLSYGQT